MDEFDISEQDLLSNLVSKIRDQIDSNYKIQEETVASSGIPADSLIEDEEGKAKTIIEAKTNVDNQGSPRALQQLKIYVEESEAEFGMLVTPSINYLFSISEENDSLELSYTDLNTIYGGDETKQRRAFRSYQELAFCYDRARHEAKRVCSQEISIENIVWELQRIATAEKRNLPLDPQADFVDQIQNIDKKVQGEIADLNKHNQGQIPLSEFAEKESSAYNEYFSRLKLRKIIHGVFRGFSIDETDNEILQKFVENLTSNSADQQYSTPLGLSEYIIQLADIESGDDVLDPACGWGNLLREAERAEANGVGIDVSSRAILTASGCNSLLDFETEFCIGDGIENSISTFRGQFDHVVLDPPRKTSIEGEKISSRVPKVARRDISTVFIASSLAALNPTGQLTALIPIRLLTGDQYSDFRQFLLNEYHIDRVIEVKNESILHTLEDRTGIIQISKRNSSNLKTTFEVFLNYKPESSIKNHKNIEKLEKNLETDRLVGVSTLSPVEVQEITSAFEDINESYSEVKNLKDVRFLSSIKSGNQVTKEETTHTDDGLPYLRIKNRSDPDSSLPRVDPAEHRIAGPRDVLISTTGTVTESYLPEQDVVPDQNWAILRFDTHEAALIYHCFFQTPLGSKVLDAVSIERTIRYIPLSRLEQIPVPKIPKSEIDKLAVELPNLLRDIKHSSAADGSNLQNYLLEVLNQ